ncbi:hypothetical protein E1B28_009770 [Marasmius oreades]|uniref:DUF6534 domain-containing protein n=1 Tax=Marasmius oreades TaxID=181124 RepID=A0A9P7RVR0_9AGAR|nr:uncharacterized protein E1B28_009770 [Marasmius oreades]KAG7090671.1 hypothetical protein E1B28_009770 [Marasmius oreades]
MLTQIILAGHDFFGRFANPNRISRLNFENLGWLYVPVLGGTVEAAVQMLYAWRISVLSQSHVGPFLLVALSIASACSAYTSATFGSKVSNISTLNSDSLGLRIASTVWYASSAVCDVMIAVYMVRLLTRSRSSVSSTRAAIGRIVRLTVETNALTASFAVATLVLLLATPGKTYFLTLSLLLPSIYANAFLVMLNLRYRLTQPGVPDPQPSFCRASLSTAPSSMRPGVHQPALVSFQEEHELGSNLRTKDRSDDLENQWNANVV